MTERIFSVLLLLAVVYGGVYFARTDPDGGMVWLCIGMTVLSIWTVHAVWTAPVFDETN
jgi:hypothetical protein